jgi:AraC-like DNA-binding protein
MTAEGRVDWPGGGAVLTHIEPFTATDHPPVFSPYVMSMVFTPVRGRFRLDETRIKDYAAPRCTLTLAASRRVEHLASNEGGHGVILSVNSEEYKSTIDRLTREGSFEDGVIHRSGDAVAWAVMARLRSILRDDPDPSFLALESLSVLIQRHVIALVGGGRCGRHGELSKARLQRVIDFMDEHLAKNVSLTALADIAALSPFHFLRSFKRTTGMSPHQFFLSRRLEMARVAIEEGVEPRDAGWWVGFFHPRHFASLYRRHHGFWPLDTPRLKAQPPLGSTGIPMSPAVLSGLGSSNVRTRPIAFQL